jgi:hypothetical protein
MEKPIHLVHDFLEQGESAAQVFAKLFEKDN